MLDQELASAMRFLIKNSGNPKPHYFRIPEGFKLPAVYFPEPQLDTDGFTLDEYALDFTWPVKFFADTDRAAHAMGFQALTELKRKNNLILLIDEDGNTLERGFRTREPVLRLIDDGVAQLMLRWTSPRPYFRPEAEKMMVYHLRLFVKDAFNRGVEQIETGG